MDKKKTTEEEKPVEERAKVEIVQLDDENIRIQDHPYKLLENYREGFDKEKLAERYSDVLKKYDYIVGDWGYDQLRLKGFYNRNYSQAKMDQQIENVEDYLLEYCNFGCAYFVLENLKKMPKAKLKAKAKKQPQQKKKKPTTNKKSTNNIKKKPVANKKKQNTTTKKKSTNSNSNKKNNFKIRKINNEK